VPLLRGLLASHASWFKLQRCPDPFQQQLSIDQLTAAAAAANPAAATKAPAAMREDAAMHDSSEEAQAFSSDDEEGGGPAGGAGGRLGVAQVRTSLCRLRLAAACSSAALPGKEGAWLPPGGGSRGAARAAASPEPDVPALLPPLVAPVRAAAPREPSPLVVPQAVVAREAEILRLMEILELPRSVAIELLEQNEGSVEGALMQVLG
jgi:hypothetical protein